MSCHALSALTSTAWGWLSESTCDSCLMDTFWSCARKAESTTFNMPRVSNQWVTIWWEILQFLEFLVQITTLRCLLRFSNGIEPQLLSEVKHLTSSFFHLMFPALKSAEINPQINYMYLNPFLMTAPRVTQTNIPGDLGKIIQLISEKMKAILSGL